MALAMMAILIVAPSAYATRPTREVYVTEGAEPKTLPAGSGCAFDVLRQPLDGGRAAVTEFEDGRMAGVVNGEALLTNEDNGATFLHRARFSYVDVYDPATNDLIGLTRGEVLWWFAPGEVGPYGVVGEPGLLIRFVGQIRSVFDLDTEFVTAFSYVGTATDVCALLAD